MLLIALPQENGAQGWLFDDRGLGICLNSAGGLTPDALGVPFMSSTLTLAQITFHVTFARAR